MKVWVVTVYAGGPADIEVFATEELAVAGFIASALVLMHESPQIPNTTIANDNDAANVFEFLDIPAGLDEYEVKGA